MMSLWNISRTVAELLEMNKEVEVLDILTSYPPEQRRFIVAIQHDNSSLLFQAITRKLILVAIYFLQECEADPNSHILIRGRKFTCLAVATFIDSPILVKTLLYYQADTEIVFSSNEITVLFYACSLHKPEIVQLLLEDGADPNQRNSVGETCLINSMGNLNVFKLLVSSGADINLTGRFGVTCLILALKRRMYGLINFLLELEDTQVRLIEDSGTDALYYAVFFSPRHVIEKVAENGSYTTEELAMAYEMRCCKFHVTNFKEQARSFWQKALELRRKPIETRMFTTLHQNGKLDEVINLFNANDIPPLLFLDSISEFSLYTAHIYTLAASNVREVELYVRLCEFFFNELKSMEDTQFFRMLFHAEELMTCFFKRGNMQKLHALKILDLLTNYIEQIKTRLGQMEPEQRSVHGFKIDHLVLTIIQCFSYIHWAFRGNINWLYYSIKHLIELDLRGPCQKSLFQKCANSYRFLIERVFLGHQADVNNSDRLGKTILHDLIETANLSPETISLIIDHGFDFKAVKYDEYCLSCRLKEMGLLQTPAKHTSLKCLAVKAFCENVMTSFNEVPLHLMSFVKSHL